MKDFLFRLAFLTLILLVIPSVFILIFQNDEPKGDINYIELYDVNTQRTLKLDTEEYILGVVCAEMPAEFNEEALKAQAVAARTYTLYNINNKEHEKGDICSDYAHCQAYASFDELKNKWGKNYDKYLKKVKNCVDDTKGLYISFNGEAINAVFHACSNGQTENASDVWGKDVAYLKSVESPGDLLKNNYINESLFDKATLIQLLENQENIKLDYTKAPVGNIIHTEGVNVKSIDIYGVTFKGTDLRKLLTLNSSAFDISFENDVFTFKVYGNGHGVGMSQYGANAMGKDGKDFKEILGHYYPDTSILSIK